MSYRYMRMILFFDLPSVKYADQKSYRKFRKFLIKEGFLQMQESVYIKLAINNSVAESISSKIRKQCPNAGTVQMLVVTEKQFASMISFVGQFDSESINSDERMVVL